MKSCLRAAVFLLTLAVPARALVISEDPLEGDSTSIGGNTRMYNLVMRGGPLSSPLVPSSFNPAAVSIVAFRPQFALKRGSGFDLVIHEELVSTTSSAPTPLLGGALALGQGRTAPLWLPLQGSAVNRDTYQLRDRLDWAYARYSSSELTFTLGRQPITIGRGQIWTPEDLIAPFSPLQIDTEYKPGADAARLDWTISESLTLLVVGTAAKNDNSTLVSRAQFAMDSLQIGVMAGSVRSDVVAAMDLFVDLGKGTDLHAEGTTTWVTKDARRPSGRHAFSRAVLGSTTELLPTLHMTAEAYYNGAGARSPEDYVAELSSARLAVGEVYNVGRAYAGLAADWQIHPLVHAQFSLMGNLEDPSAIVAPLLRYSVAENASIVAGSFIPLGRAPNYSSGIVASSEFGLYPQLYHVDAKLWF